MPHFNFNFDVGTLIVSLGTVLYLLADRYTMISRHDREIAELSVKLTEVSEKLIELTTKFQTYLDFRRELK